MGTLMTSQQSYSILRGTQLRILSRVLLEIACTCIMHRECARGFTSFGLFNMKALTFHMQQGNNIVVNSVIGAERGGWHPRDILQA
jgi:hypothetical protein